MSIYSSTSANKADSFNSTNPILEALTLLCVPGNVYELRCPNTPKRTISGYFDDLQALADFAAELSGKVPAVYVTLNPVKPDLLARANNRVETYAKHTAADPDIVCRFRLPVDFDPVRPAGISSSDAEHNAALERARECRAWLAEQGWPGPILADSGNGGHLVYGLDLPNDEASARLLSDFLQALSARFSDNRVKADTTIFNAARIWKLYGTMACKGENVPERPHRRAAILEAPAALVPVPRELIERVAALKPQPGPAATAASTGAAATAPAYTGPGFDVAAFLARHKGKLPVKEEKTYKGGRKWILEVCPFDPEHTGGCAVVLQGADGRAGFKCPHNGCKGKNWKAVRELCGETAGRGRGGQSLAARLVKAAKEAADLFVTPGKVAYASVRIGGRQDCCPVLSADFKRWLVTLAGDGAVVNKKAVDDAAFTLEALAFKAGTAREVHLRTAKVDNRVYLDLADTEGRVVEITADGWKVTAGSPVPFVRPGNMAALPEPERGGHVDLFREYVNVTEEDWPLVRAFLLDCLKGQGPYLSLLVNGGQGSAKSSLCRFVRWVFDPVTRADLSNKPRDERDLAACLNSNAVLAFDNVSTLPQWLSDALCSIATGAGFRARKNYTDGEEVTYGGSRPILFNGIPDFAESSDLLDRALKVTCPDIPPEKRRTEEEIRAAFEAALPRILGGILDAVGAGLRHVDAVKLDKLPRMADAARWVAACERGIGQEGRFLAAYDRCRGELDRLVLDNSLVADALLRWIEGEKGSTWEGTAAELLAALRDRAEPGILHGTDFPRVPKRLSEQLTRLAPNLRAAGVAALPRKSGGRKLWKIGKIGTGQGQTGSQGSQGSQESPVSSVEPKEKDEREGESSKGIKAKSWGCCDPCDPCDPEPARQPDKDGNAVKPAEPEKSPVKLTQWDDYALFLNARNGVGVRFKPRFAARVPEAARPLLGTRNEQGEYVRELAEPGDKTWKGAVERVLAEAGRLVKDL
jgi:hypothetical protein